MNITKKYKDLLPEQCYRLNEEYLLFLKEPRSVKEIMDWLADGDDGIDKDLLNSRVVHKMCYLKHEGYITVDRRLAAGNRYEKTYQSRKCVDDLLHL